MNRRELLTTAVVAALPWRRLRADTGWRTFELTTRAQILKPQGVSRAWLPLPLAADTDWQRAAVNTWSGNARRTEVVQAGKYGVSMLYAEWESGQKEPFVELRSRVATRDRDADLSRRSAPSLSRAESALYTAPTETIPCDGLVRETALLRMAKGARTDVEKGRRIYEWIVENTFRDPKTRGCGTGNIKAMIESGNYGGKCADLNGLFVAFARSLGIPARDVYGIRVASSAHGYKSLGASSAGDQQGAALPRGVLRGGSGLGARRPGRRAQGRPRGAARTACGQRSEGGGGPEAAVRVMGDELGGLQYGPRRAPRPGSSGPQVPFLMYPNAETGGERLDQLDPDGFKYAIGAREV